MPQNANDGGAWIFTGANNVDASSFGTSAPDLMMVVTNLSSAVCQQLNALLKLGASHAETGGFGATKFTGAFATTDQIGSGDGARAECTSIGGVNQFYSVLLER